MPLVLLAHFLARVLGFRHRDSEEFYRIFDVIGGFWLIVPILATQTLLSGLAHWLLPSVIADGVENILNVLMTALGICAVTIWMPLVEHISLLEPGDMRAGGRRLAVWQARAIPYCYGLVALAFAVVMAVVFVGMIILALMGFSEVLPGPDIQDAPRWIGVVVVILTGLWMFGLF